MTVPKYHVLAQLAAEIMTTTPAILNRTATERWVRQILDGCPRAGEVLLDYVTLEIEENLTDIKPEDAGWLKHRTIRIVGDDGRGDHMSDCASLGSLTRYRRPCDCGRGD